MRNLELLNYTIAIPPCLIGNGRRRLCVRHIPSRLGGVTAHGRGKMDDVAV